MLRPALADRTPTYRFGSEDCKVFAGNPGECIITITNSGFSTTASGVVTSFTPTPLSFVTVPGFANNVDVSGDFAYVAARAAGLQVVDVSDRNSPQIVGSVATPGNANDVKVVGSAAFVADGSAGLHVVNVSTPSSPAIIGAVDTPDDAHDVVVRSNSAPMSLTAQAGSRSVTSRTPTQPVVVVSADTPGTAKGVDVDAAGQLAVVADGTSGLHTVSLVTTQILGTAGTAGDARDVVLSEADLASCHSAALLGSRIFLSSTSQNAARSVASLGSRTDCTSIYAVRFGLQNGPQNQPKRRQKQACGKRARSPKLLRRW